MTQIVVTGCTGFLGRHLMPVLKARYGEANVVGVCSSDFDLLKAADVERLFRVHQPEILVHLAAYSGGIGANRAYPADFFYKNALFVTLIFEAAARYGVKKLVYTMGGCSYPASAASPISEDQLWDGYPQPESAGYSVAKKMGLVASQTYRQQYGLNSVVLIPGNMYGEYDNFREDESHVIPAMIRRYQKAKLAGDKEIVMWGDGTAVRDFVYAADVARLIPWFIDNYDSSTPVNVSSGTKTSIRELAEALRAKMRWEGEIKWDTGKPNGQSIKVFDVAKLRSLGLACDTRLSSGLDRTVDWFNRNAEAETDGIRLRSRSARSRHRKECPICSERELRLFSEVAGRTLIICHHCRHVCFGDVPTDQELASYYSASYSEHHAQLSLQLGNRSYYRNHVAELIDLTRSSVSDFSLLDYGCSYPILLEVAKETGVSRVLGCDYCAHAGDYGRQRGIPIISPEAIPEVTERFDVIRFSHVLEHHPAPDRVLRMIGRLLKPAGAVYITQPSFPTFKAGWTGLQLRDAVYPSHLHFFSAASLCALARASGLRVVKLFTHQNENAASDLYGDSIDEKCASELLKPYRACGEATFGALNNYPHFFGENSVAVFAAPGPSTVRVQGSRRNLTGRVRRVLGTLRHKPVPSGERT